MAKNPNNWLIGNRDHMFIDKTKRKVLDDALHGSVIRSVMAHPPFLLSKNLMTINLATSKGNKAHDKMAQIEDWESIWEDPFPEDMPYTFCISSAPNETMAQVVAMRLFLRAFAVSEDTTRRKPYWHNLRGGVVHDRFRDREDLDMKVSMLILNNCPYDMTPYKLEKLRDILTEYSHIPRVIITSDQDPIEFMNQKLKMQVNFALYIGAEKEKRWIPSEKDL